MRAIVQTETAEQLTMLRDSAASFVRDNTDLKALRARRGTLPGFDSGLIRPMGALGWFGILVP